MFCTECWEPFGRGTGRKGRHVCADKRAPRVKSAGWQSLGPGFNRQRALELAVLYRGGCTLREIGDAVGISRERVRQLITVVDPEGLRGGTGGGGAKSLSWRVENDIGFRRATRIGIDRLRRRQVGARAAWREKITAALVEFSSIHKRAPSYRELAAKLGIASGETGHMHGVAVRWAGYTAIRNGTVSCATALHEAYASADLEVRGSGGAGHVG